MGRTVRLPINEFYGQTEANLVSSHCFRPDASPHGAMGVPVPGHERHLARCQGRASASARWARLCPRPRPGDVPALLDEARRRRTGERSYDGWLPPPPPQHRRSGDAGMPRAKVTFHAANGQMSSPPPATSIGPKKKKKKVEIEQALACYPDVVMAAPWSARPTSTRPHRDRGRPCVCATGADWSGMEQRCRPGARNKVLAHCVPPPRSSAPIACQMTPPARSCGGRCATRPPPPPPPPPPPQNPKRVLFPRLCFTNTSGGVEGRAPTGSPRASGPNSLHFSIERRNGSHRQPHARHHRQHRERRQQRLVDATAVRPAARIR